MWLQQAGPEAWTLLTRRQHLKYRHLDKVWFAWFYWAAVVFPKRAFLDGLPGMRLARFKRHYFQQVRLKIQESRRTRLPA